MTDGRYGRKPGEMATGKYKVSMQVRRNAHWGDPESITTTQRSYDSLGPTQSPTFISRPEPVANPIVYRALLQ
jgi:hypothetical protein